MRCKDGGESVSFDKGVGQVEWNADRVLCVTGCVSWVVSPEEVSIFFVVDIVDADNIRRGIGVRNFGDVLIVQEESEGIVEKGVDILVVFFAAKHVFEGHFWDVAIADASEFKLQKARVIYTDVVSFECRVRRPHVISEL